MKEETMKLLLTALAASALLTSQNAVAAAEPQEGDDGFGKRRQGPGESVVPSPARQPTESTPPSTARRGHPLQLAQADTAPAAPRIPPSPPLDPNAVASWAESFAVSTTQGVLDQIFPRGSAGARRPVIVGGDNKNVSTLNEDLTVMMRILEKTATVKTDGPPTAAGIELFSMSRSSSPRVFYLEGYGALFVLNVKYPLLAPPKRDESSHTNETNTEWEKAKAEVYGNRVAFEDVKIHAPPGEEFDAQRVENLKEDLLRDLLNAKNIRHLKSEDSVSVVVLGSGPRVGGSLIRKEARSTGGREAGARLTSGEALSQTTLTLRARKSDIDALAKGKLDHEAFKKKVTIQIY